MSSELDRSELWPSRPPVGYRLADADWTKLKSLCELPDITLGGADCRALLEWEVYNARELIAAARRAPSLRDVRNQLGRIARTRPGRKMPRSLLDDVVGLLAGRALGDRSKYKDHPEWMARIRAAPTVTTEIRQWARQCVLLGAARRTWRQQHGGGANPAEQDFICGLRYFWRERLGRKETNWAGIRRRQITRGRSHRRVIETIYEDNAAPLTVFVTTCLNLAGAQGPTGEPITLANARHRIRRAAANLLWM